MTNKRIVECTYEWYAVRGSFTNYMSCPNEVIGGGGRGAKFGHGCVP